MEKWPIFELNHGLTPLENCQFFDFFNFLFFLPRNAFFRSRISQNTVSWPILPEKKNMEKWPIFEENHGLTPLEKCQFFDFFNLLFFLPRMRFFLLEYHKTRFPRLYCLKKISWKNANFRAKPWVNPFGEMSIFPLFELVVFIAQKCVF